MAFIAVPVCFPNAGGGQIVVGVDNTTKEILGVDWTQEKESRVYQEAAKCTPKIQPKSVVIVPVPKKGKVVVIEISPSQSIHQDDHQKFPLRMGDGTTYMDANLLITVARVKGLIAGEQLLNNAVEVARLSPKRIAFLTQYLSDSDSDMRAKAVEEVGNAAWHYEIEAISGLSAKLLELLNDDDSKVRMATLNALGVLSWRMSDKKKREYPFQGYR
jgi:predicted HTH transcriptional regulator